MLLVLLYLFSAVTSEKAPFTICLLARVNNRTAPIASSKCETYEISNKPNAYKPTAEGTFAFVPSVGPTGLEEIIEFSTWNECKYPFDKIRNLQPYSFALQIKDHKKWNKRKSSQQDWTDFSLEGENFIFKFDVKNSAKDVSISCSSGPNTVNIVDMATKHCEQEGQITNGIAIVYNSLAAGDKEFKLSKQPTDTKPFKPNVKATEEPEPGEVTVWPPKYSSSRSLTDHLAILAANAQNLPFCCVFILGLWGAGVSELRFAKEKQF